MNEGNLTGHVPIRVLFDKSGANPGTDLGLTVVSGEATFAMSDLFEIRLLVQTSDALLRLGGLLRRPVEVSFDAEAFVPKVDGIVRRVRVVSIEPAGVSRYELFVVPDVWLLTLRRNHRIFANLAVVEIVAGLFGEHRAQWSVAPALLSDHATREYTVQYGETDLHAVQRLLADEGIATYFDFAQGDFVVTDDTSKKSMSLKAPLRFAPAGSSLSAAGAHCYDFRPGESRHVGKALIRDYDYHRPKTPIEGVQDFGNDVDLEHYAYEVGEVADEKAAGARAADTMLSLAAPTLEAVCTTNCLIAPGTTFRIDGHARVESEKDLLVLAVTSSWSASASGAGEAQHEITCMLATNPFKPVRLEKPRIAGVQTALVVGEGSKEIDVDDEGNVQVEFRWDRRGIGALGTSRRVRVSQGWAGVGYGLVTVPRVGDEVVVAYLDGDPDEPLIVGRVHNPLRPNPLKMPDDQTVSVWRTRSSPGGDGYNEILMDDLAGKERFAIHAQQDYSEVVERDANVVIKRDEKRTVHGDRTTRTVGKGDMQYADGFSISTPKGGTISAKDLKINAENRDDETTDTYKNHAAVSKNSASTLYTIDAPTIVLTSPGACITMAGGTIFLKANLIEINGDVVDIHGNPINLNC